MLVLLFCGPAGAQWQNQQQFNQWHSSVMGQLNPQFQRAYQAMGKVPGMSGYQSQLMAMQKQLNGMTWQPIMPPGSRAPQPNPPQVTYGSHNYIENPPKPLRFGSYGWEDPNNPAMRPAPGKSAQGSSGVPVPGASGWTATPAAGGQTGDGKDLLPPIGPQDGRGATDGGAAVSGGAVPGSQEEIEKAQRQLNEWLKQVGSALGGLDLNGDLTPEQVKARMDGFFNLLTSGLPAMPGLLPASAARDSVSARAVTPDGIETAVATATKDPFGEQGRSDDIGPPLAPAGTSFFGLGGGRPAQAPTDPNVVDLSRKTDMMPRIPQQQQPAYEEAKPPPSGPAPGHAIGVEASQVTLDAVDVLNSFVQQHLDAVNGVRPTQSNRSVEDQLGFILLRPDSYPNITKGFKDRFGVENIPANAAALTPEQTNWFLTEILKQAKPVGKGFAHVADAAQDISVKGLSTSEKQILKSMFEAKGYGVYPEKGAKYGTSIDDATVFHIYTEAKPTSGGTSP